MSTSPPTMKLIRRIGASLLVIGALPLVWTLYKSKTLPYYLLLAAFVPFSFGIPLYSVNDYFDGWSSLGPRQKGRAIAWLFVPFLVLVGALWWYATAPAAKA